MTAKLEQGKCANVIQPAETSISYLSLSVAADASTQAGYFQVYDCAPPTPPSACQKLPSHHALWDFSTICLAKPRNFWVGLLCSKTKRGLILFHFVITAIYQQTTQMDLKFP